MKPSAGLALLTTVVVVFCGGCSYKSSEPALTSQAAGGSKSDKPAQFNPTRTGDLESHGKQVDAKEGRVSVVKQPAVVELVLSTPPGKRREHFAKERAYTEWFYHCICSASYEVVSQTRKSDVTTAVIRIDKLKIELSLPITMHERQHPSAQFKAHEQGHVDICERVYNDAEQVAKEAGTEIIDQRFTGSGLDLDSARKDALSKAAAAVSNQYRARVIERAQKVSEYYDALQGDKEPMQPAAAVDEAFNQYNMMLRANSRNQRLLGTPHS